MDGPGGYHTKWRKPEKTNFIIYHLSVKSKNNTDEVIYKREADSQTEKVNFREERGGRGTSWESEINVGCVCSAAQSWPTLWGPMDCSPPGSSSMAFSRQEYWSELPFPTPGNLPNPGVKPGSLGSPALPGGFFITSVNWEAPNIHTIIFIYIYIYIYIYIKCVCVCI